MSTTTIVPPERSAPAKKTTVLNRGLPDASKIRLAYLDGLRGVAILLVIAFHFYGRSINPVAEFILVKHGNLGVNLFFAISGFVISQTLHASASPKHFAIKRFARLFPAMFVCSSLTIAFSFLGPRTYSSTFSNFLPSLTFIDPNVFNTIFRVNNFNWMDPSYWSLFTEIRFYLIAAILYFLGRAAFFRNFLIFAIVVGLVFPMAIFLQVSPL